MREDVDGWTLTRDRAVAWVNAYGEAWQSQDEEKILALYTEDAVYVERPYDPEGGVYRGHVGIRDYWLTHVQVRERNIQFRQLVDNIVIDESTNTAVATWEASFQVARTVGESVKWSNVQFLQIAILRFACDGRVRQFDEWWHGKSLQKAQKGLRDPRSKRTRAGPKRRLPKLGNRTCANAALFGACLGPFEFEAVKLKSRARFRKSGESGSTQGAIASVGDEAEKGVDSADAQTEITGGAVVVASKVPPKQAPISISKSLDLIDWYRQAVFAADLVQESDVAGAPLFRPWGAFLWEELRRWVDVELAALEVLPFQMPILAHQAGGSALLEVRSSSEPLLYTEMAKHWVLSSRDLPVLISRWGVAVTDQSVKRPVPWLRSRELSWQEGYGAHVDAHSAKRFSEAVQKVYVRMCEELLAVSPRVRQGLTTVGATAPDQSVEASNSEAMGISEEMGSIVVEVPISRRLAESTHVDDSDVGAVEVASLHHLGCGTAEAFKLQYGTKDSHGRQVKKSPFQTCFSLTCRALGAALCIHGDDRGVVMPPRLAPVQVVIIPVIPYQGCSGAKPASVSPASDGHSLASGNIAGGRDDRVVHEIMGWCESAMRTLRQSESLSEVSWANGPLRAQMAGRLDVTPGKKIRYWQQRGVPIIVAAQWTPSGQLVQGDGAAPSRQALVRIIARDYRGHDDLNHYNVLTMRTSDAVSTVRRELLALHRRMLSAHRLSIGEAVEENRVC